MTAQQQYWYKINQQRNAAYARLMHAQYIARKLVAYVINGGDINDLPPDEKDGYRWLVDEFGEKFFTDELNNCLIQEQQKDKKEN